MNRRVMLQLAFAAFAGAMGVGAVWLLVALR